MSRWDHEAAKQLGYPEDYLNWYEGYYKPRVNENAVGVDKAIQSGGRLEQSSVSSKRWRMR